MKYLVLVFIILDLFGRYIVFIKDVFIIGCVNLIRVMLLFMGIGELYFGWGIMCFVLNFCLVFFGFFLLRFLSVMVYMFGFVFEM